MRNWRKLFSALKMNTTPDEKFDPKELQMGIQVEKEHGVTDEEAKSIAKDHLQERSNYYSLLKRYVEKESSKLSQDSEKINSKYGRHYLHCPSCGHQAPEEDFVRDRGVFNDQDFSEGYGETEEEDYAVCPQCGITFDAEAGDSFYSKTDLF
jgi:uncharacterized C2H2 Zn-finger protein